jgi:L-threonylcarbamoyladenylate synthase
MSNSQFFSNCTADTIREAAAALKAGHLVAFPTETVYGLGADARNPEAVKRIYEVKGRPSDHPLIVHISSINQLEKWATEIPEYAIDLARAFWPGPMTLILKRTEIAQDFITGGQETVGLRVPSDPIALALIQEFEKISESAIAAPSANRFGQVSPTSCADVQEELGEYLSTSDLVLDGGRSQIGIESTIIDCTSNEPKLLRPGAITPQRVKAVLDMRVHLSGQNNLLRYSGALEHHYSPRAIVKLDGKPVVGQGMVAMSGINTPEGAIRLASPEDSIQYAKCLYKAMRLADQMNLNEVVFIQPPAEGIGVAIRERLQKSARGRKSE